MMNGLVTTKPEGEAKEADSQAVNIIVWSLALLHALCSLALLAHAESYAIPLGTVSAWRESNFKEGMRVLALNQYHFYVVATVMTASNGSNCFVKFLDGKFLNVKPEAVLDVDVWLRPGRTISFKTRKDDSHTISGSLVGETPDGSFTVEKPDKEDGVKHYSLKAQDLMIPKNHVAKVASRRMISVAAKSVSVCLILLSLISLYMYMKGHMPSMAYVLIAAISQPGILLSAVIDL